MTAVSVSAVHADARERGARPWLYAIVRRVLWLLVHTWFRVTVDGAAAVPASGAVIVAPNHKSVVDAFLVGLAIRRRVRFMAKAELFAPPLGGLLLRLGAFPVRRGERDDEAMQTARMLLAQGEALVLFPEGTRVEDADALGSPHHGAGRLALDAGAPIVPAAISGTGHLWLGPIPKPRSLHVSFLSPITPDAPDATELIDRRVWPAVLDEYGRLRATPGLVATVLAAAGLGGLAARQAHRARRPPAVLGVLEPRRIRRRRRRG
jgi:1-acyl-sn-glycerol-3-phosphate acyltransferase